MGKGDIIMYDNQKYDYLIKEMTNHMTNTYLYKIGHKKEFKDNMDTSPLLNLTLSVFISSLINVLDVIKKNTIGEVKLIQNIDTTKVALVKAIEDLPWIKGAEYIK